MKMHTLLAALALVVAGFSEASARRWSDATGKYHVEADLLEVSGEKVRLKASDGRIIDVPIDRLSAADRQYLDSLRQSAKAVAPGEGIEKALATPTDFEFIATPLDQVLEYVKERHNIPFYLDERSLREAGISADKTVDANLKGKPLAEALDSALDPMGAAWTVRHEVLFITSKQRASSLLETRVYKLQRVSNPNALVAEIQRTIAAESQKGGGAPGAVKPLLPDLLVILQSYRVHRQLAGKYRAQMHCVSSAEENTSRQVQGIPAKLLKALQQPTRCQFIETPLEQVFKWLKNQHSVPIEIDVRGLADQRLSVKTPVTLNLQGIRLESLLSLMTEQLGLAWVVRDGVLMITSPEEADGNLLMCQYDVRDLMPVLKGPSPLMELLTSTVRPASWRGRGSATVAPGKLVIMQTFQTQLEIQRVLNDMRQARKRR
ncbi:MAG: hypothetical protein H8E44_41115 [Planctomycetes bacterium]|nr:hypothetical protein [Planctomycetota bacterium]